jgi:low affinity Fe/Cu permease
VRAAKVTVKVTNETAETVPISTSTTIVTGSDRFGKFAAKSSHYLGSRWAFVIAIAIIVVWALTGPIFHYSDTWQLIINTGTTIVTFLMVFLIQNTQNRDAKAIHLKLNELIHAVDKAKNHMIDVENLSDLEIDELAKTYDRFRTSAQDRKQAKDSVSSQEN